MQTRNVLVLVVLALAAACGPPREEAEPRSQAGRQAKAEPVRGIMTLVAGHPQLQVCGGSKVLGVAGLDGHTDVEIAAGVLYAKMTYGGRFAAQALYIEAEGRVDGDTARLGRMLVRQEVPSGTAAPQAAAECKDAAPGAAAGVPPVRGVFTHEGGGRGELRPCGQQVAVRGDIMEAAELPAGAVVYIEGDGEISENMVLGESRTVQRANVRRVSAMRPEVPAGC